MGSPEAHCSAGAGERQQSMGEQPHVTSRKSKPPCLLWNAPDPYLRGSEGEAGGNVAGNIHQPRSQHM